MPSVQAINKEEKTVIKDAFDDLYQLILPKCTEDDKIHLKMAFELSEKAHGNQRRKSGEPYILHPIEVAKICFEEIGLGPTAVVAAVLHDVVEDTNVTIEEILETFGPKICRIVDGLTKLDGLYNVESPQAENFKKVLSTLVEDVRVVLIKMSDRLHNLRTIGVMPRHKQLKIAAETSYIYIPLAHRLGLYTIKTEFQDICLKITEPEIYSEIEQKLSDTEQDRQEYIDKFIKPIKPQLEELGLSYRVQARSKAISSILSKIKKKKVPFEEIYDLFAVRIIIDAPQEKEKSFCWQIYSIITDHFKPIPERLKDWVTTPKGNGYESLHTTVIGPAGKYVEVQVRSERMDDIAERGFAAHWKYKGVKNEHSVYDKWIQGVRDLLDTSHSDALEFLNDFKTNLFSEEIYVFTPNGDMKILPKGATALDFAFDIHTDIGYQATSLKVNNKLVPMGYKLANGDQIHVITNKNQKPKENWLKMVVTGKARSKIRSSMKEEKRKQGQVGKEALERKLRNMKVDFEDNVDTIVKGLGFVSRPDLYFALAMDDIKMSELKRFDNTHGKLTIRKELIPGNIASTGKAAIKSTDGPAGKSNILVNGEPADDYKYELAKCCKPVQGDDIFAYLTSTAGMKVHRVNCKNATHLLANFGYRVLKAEWKGKADRNFIVDLLVTGVDSGPGVIQELTNEISNKLGVNIRSFSIEGTEGYFEGKISIFVLNKDQLNVVLKAIEKLDGISTVTRIEK